MARLAEFSYQQGSEADFEAYVRDQFPQCIQVDENGDELVPVQYTSAYSHTVGIHYVPALTLVDGQAPQNQALMVDWHREPESTEQKGRIEARVLIVGAFNAIPDTPENKDIRDLLAGAFNSISNSGFAGIGYLTVTTLAWAGQPLGPEQAQEALEQISVSDPAVKRALDALRTVKLKRA